METYSEITNREIEERQRAHRFESLRDEAIGVRNSIKAKSRTSDDGDVAEKILGLAEKLSADFITGPVPGGGHSFVPSGCEARSVISDVCLGALRQFNQREARREAELKTKRKRLAEIEE